MSRTSTVCLLRCGASGAEIAGRRRTARWGKRAGRRGGAPDFLQPDRPMSAIGG
ncbi:hypothetical protein OH809_39650 [Streptomyces sp. NBC_00873]|uniref:hypothetical protein n=1 Tax=unclassified Streptomyces TaxID=2593676 RepID=UPI00386AFB7C|nr:hypothetical protein OH809_39650 [Streptomyces sp. NBC_00873]WTA41915.1 hypothetical protein OH821_04045 [Streptomyces sp. NBC_00842]